MNGVPLFTLNCALMGLVVALTTILVAAATRKARTEWQMAGLLVGLGLLVLVPSLVWAASSIGVGQIQTLSEISQVTPQTFTPPSQVEAGITAGTATSASPPMPARRSIDYMTWIAPAWATISSLLVLRGIYRRFVLGRWLRGWEATGKVESAIVYRGPIRAPFCGGIYRPFIALPEDFDSLPEDEREAVLLHEQAHLSHRHPWQGLLSEMAGDLFFWLPPVYWLKGRLAELQERQCDEEVLRRHGAGKSLARSIVTFAERIAGHPSPQPTFSIVRSRGRLESRVQQLLVSKEIPMKPRKSSLIVVALLSTAGITAVATSLQVPAQEDVSQYMPFRKGALWTYKLAAKNGGYTRTMTAMAIKDAKPYPVMEFFNRLGKSGYYSYWKVTPEGLRPVDSSSRLMGEPGFHLNPVKAPLLPSSLALNYEWKWDEPFVGQIMSEPGKETKWPDPAKMTGKIEALHQTVKVPAGTYETVVVSTRSQGSSWLNITTKTYWAKNVGIVKTEVFDAKGNLVQNEELVSYRPETP